MRHSLSPLGSSWSSKNLKLYIFSSYTPYFSGKGLVMCNKTVSNFLVSIFLSTYAVLSLVIYSFFKLKRISPFARNLFDGLELSSSKGSLIERRN